MAEAKAHQNIDIIISLKSQFLDEGQETSLVGGSLILPLGQSHCKANPDHSRRE